MSERTKLGDGARQITLTFNVPDYLSVSLAKMRYLLEVGISGRRSVHRGEIVRLAIERLYLDFLRHESIDPAERERSMADYDKARLRLEFDPMCPDWLLPPILIQQESSNGNTKSGGSEAGSSDGGSGQDTPSVLHGAQRHVTDVSGESAAAGSEAPTKRKPHGRKRKASGQ